LNNGEFIILVYRNVPGREPDPTGFDYWTGQLTNGILNRGKIMVAFSESAEYKARVANTVTAILLYQGMLRRVPKKAVWIIGSGN